MLEFDGTDEGLTFGSDFDTDFLSFVVDTLDA